MRFKGIIRSGLILASAGVVVLVLFGGIAMFLDINTSTSTKDEYKISEASLSVQPINDSLPKNVAIINPSDGLVFIRRCSSGQPNPPDNFWSVSLPQVSFLEHLLKKYVETHNNNPNTRVKLNFDHSIRQYIGMSYGDKKYLYINSFPRGEHRDKTKIVTMCDGGSLYWGILYNIDEGTFEKLFVEPSMPLPIPGTVPKPKMNLDNYKYEDF